jgi:hypothetical protein
MDGVKDGTETGIDCGGGACAPCADGQGCKLGTDCTDRVCDPTAKTCAAPSCSDGFKNGTETDVDCGGATCDGLGHACAVQKVCGANTDCLTDLCTNGLCQFAAAGAACASNAQCANGDCVSGFCCNTACTGTCMACSAALTGGSNGTCAPMTAGSPAPTGQCAANGACGNDGKCGVGGACELQAQGTSCSATVSCVGSTVTTDTTCDGLGACSQGAGVASCPGSLTCSAGGQCNTGCGTNDPTGDALCVSGHYCDGVTTGAVVGACQALLASGIACTRGAQCTSTVCVGGLCQ